MKYFYLCMLIGNGSEEDPYRPLAADFAKNWHSPLPTTKGIPDRNWSLVEAESTPELEAHISIDALPKLAKDTQDVNNEDKDKIKVILVKYGIASTHIDTAKDYLEMLKGIESQKAALA